jgi:DnaJ-class molecular chaperone
MNPMKSYFVVQCEGCNGTGLYSGMCEAPNEPVVCLRCDGTGAYTIHYTPFTGRKRKSGVVRVHISRGTFIATGVGKVDGTSMTYAEFERRYVPPQAS